MRLSLLFAVAVLAPWLTAQDGWRLEQTSAPWTPRTDHTVTVFNGKLWLINGFQTAVTGSAGDVWSSTDGVSWVEEVSTAPWFTRSFHCTVVFDNRLWVLGGFSTSAGPGYDPAYNGYMHDVWSSPDGVNWTLETIAPWHGRHAFAAVAYNGRIWVMGGFTIISNVQYSLNDVWSSPDGVNWTQEVAAAPWSHRMTHRAVVYDNRMWVMGGGGINVYPGNSSTDVWSSTDGINWTQETPSAPWEGRSYPTLEVYRNKMWIACGLGGQNHLFFKDTWSSADGANWQRESPDATVPGRTRHGSAVFKNRLWVFGGGSDVARYNDVWSYGLHIHSTTASDWEIDHPYSATFEAREGDGPYVWSLASGGLPTGLVLGSSTTDTITLSGTPTELGAWTFTVRVEDQATNDWAEFIHTITIHPPPPPNQPRTNAGSGSGCATNPAPHIPAAILTAATATAALLRRRRQNKVA